MAIKKTETEKELTKALKNNQILKQENESLKQKIQKLDNERLDDAKVFEFQTKEIIRLKELHDTLQQQLLKSENEKSLLKISLETSKTYRNELAVKYELETKEQQEIINTLRDDLSNANIHITGLGERVYDTQNALKRYKEFSATLENDVKMMSKAIVKIMMGVERDD